MIQRLAELLGREFVRELLAEPSNGGRVDG